MNRYRRIALRVGVFILGGIITCWFVLQGNLWHEPTGVWSLGRHSAHAQSVSPANEDALEPVPVEPGANPIAPAQDNIDPVPVDPETQSAPISLVGSQPQNDATDVLISSRIELQFSNVLDDSLDTLDLTVEPEIPLQFNVAGDLIVLEPSEELSYSTQYTVTIPQQDAIPLAEPVQFSFKTEPEFTYDIDVRPLLEVSCVGCHGAFGTSRSDSVLNSFAGVMGVVEPGDESSLLIDPRFTGVHARRRAASQSLAQRYMRINGFPMDRLGAWSPEEIEIVTTWIVQDGAVESSAARQARFEVITDGEES